ncbi:MAG TPA: hypothetical protein VMN58_05805 [Acidimicrobiales bacterium]|nr:hypothetical protein [Acidimicrobiales bacterium]
MTGGASTTLERAAARLADLLTGTATTITEPRPHPGAALELFDQVSLRPLARTEAPVECWAVDGGQSVVADARCLQLLVTRAARVRYADGACTLEDDGTLRATLLGGEAERAAAVEALDVVGMDPTTSVDINLVRDRWEWEAVERCVADATPGALVLVDGDLQPDWRMPSTFLAELLAEAAARGVTLVGVTKHSSLASGGAPLLGRLEREAEASFGERSMWWAPVGRTRADVGGVTIVAARLDPDAPFSFRIDLPATAEPEAVLGPLAAVADDAAFPGYPYPLSVADGLAACPGWLRAEVRHELDSLFDLAGVPTDVRRRAFADRHDLMERS